MFRILQTSKVHNTGPLADTYKPTIFISLFACFLYFPTMFPRYLISLFSFPEVIYGLVYTEMGLSISRLKPNDYGHTKWVGGVLGSR